MSSSKPNELAPVAANQNRDHLLQDSSRLMTQPRMIQRLKTAVLGDALERESKRRLSVAVLAEAERIQETAMREHGRNAELVVAVRYQIEKDQQLIAHRNAMLELDEVAENHLSESVQKLFVAKKSNLDRLDTLEGDAQLKQEAARCIAELTVESANELIDRNLRPHHE